MIRRLAALVVAAALLSACGGDEAELTGFVRSPLPDVSAISLPDVSNGGSDFSLRAAEDRLLLVYFGYTSCPDVCPTTMSDVRTVLETLGEDGERIDVAMATVDPDRDTADVITAYVQTFLPEGHALRTTDDSRLRRAADALGAAYQVTVDADEYNVIHTGHLYAIDDQGRLQVTWPFGISRDDLQRDLEILLAAA